MSLPVIAIRNRSTVVSDSELQAVIPSLQRQVTNDFRGYWNVDCTLQWLPNSEPLIAGWWEIDVLDDPTAAGALGLHEMTASGTPLGLVFAKLDKEAGQSWTCTLSHELLEMLGDPWINWMAQGSDGNIYALETADAVEADALGYEIDGVLVSDFVTPSWFEQTAADRVDFMKRIINPLQLAPGGYISMLKQGGWVQVDAQGNPSAKYSDMLWLSPEARRAIHGIPVGSRRHRRMIPKTEWRRSLR